MEMDKSMRTSSERKKWGEIFNFMLQRLRMRDTQLETLVKERKILEDLVKMQQDRLVSDNRLYEIKISEMNDAILAQEMERSFLASKFNFVMALKDGDAHLSQLKHELTVSELEDFRAFFDVHCEKCSSLSDNHTKNPPKTSKSMEDEVKKLRQDYEKLKSEKESEVSALAMEKKFVWNQYNIMEEDYSSKLRSKDSDVERANSTIKKLLGSLEELQKSNHEKDDSICTLKTEIGRLSNELESLRKLKTVLASPILKVCNANIASSAEISHPRRSSKTGNISSKMKRNEAMAVLDSPKLFSSSMKIPKLKSNFDR